MTSAAIAVTLAMYRKRKNWKVFLVISVVFAYTTVQNIHERPEGIKIASFFIHNCDRIACIAKCARWLRVIGWNSTIWRVFHSGCGRGQFGLC
jgi:hypothetical protein